MLERVAGGQHLLHAYTEVTGHRLIPESVLPDIFRRMGFTLVGHVAKYCDLKPIHDVWERLNAC